MNKQPKKSAPKYSKEPLVFPVRINKYLAFHNYATRRGADELIENRRVSINGKIAVLGDKVLENDVVEVNKGAKQQLEADRVYLAYNKPQGVVSSVPQEGEESIGDILDFEKSVFPIGRLDKETGGLIILTNDGRITDRLLNPAHPHIQKYQVKLHKNFSPSFEKIMGDGVELPERKAQPVYIERLAPNEFIAEVTAGNSDLRRMCSSIGFEVLEIQRIQIANILLKNLRPGSYRVLAGREKEEFLESLGLSAPSTN